MFSNKETFKEAFIKKYETLYGKGFRYSTIRDQYFTLGNMVREHISTKWIETNERNRLNENKQVYYLSIEFLLGRLLGNNLINLEIREVVEEGLAELGISLTEIEESEADAGLGNGGLGRLAACFLDSLASLNLPGHGFGIRYKHGLFDQKIVDGYQVELPEQWLRHGNVWEVRRPDEAVEVRFWGEVETTNKNNYLSFRHVETEIVMAVPYDIPIIGYGLHSVNTLRIWSAEVSPHAVRKNMMDYKSETEAISEFLYPDDTHVEGKLLRLKQQYFLVSSSLQSIVRSYKLNHSSLRDFHEHISIHINDTHPVLAIPELMRILLDEERMNWDEAWNITTNTISYTNHTTLTEALEKWPIDIFQPLLPRIYMIVEEINERFCRDLWQRYPNDWERIESMAIIAHDVVKMAHLAIVGSHSVNGVAKLHSEILKKREMKLFHDVFTDKFNNKTNGIAHRRWLLKANPQLTMLLNETIGDSWISEPEKLIEVQKYCEDSIFQKQLYHVKQDRKKILARRIKDQTGLVVDTHSIFDVQVKRLHAYKRQLLNVLHIMYLYNRLKEDRSFIVFPRTFIFGAKASPGYFYAKKIIKLINSVADIVNNDPDINDMIKVVFLENYKVSLAEEIFPATDVSEQISTASKEASGTGNMKFMMNGAITIGTLDGANVEMNERIGQENMFTFGLSANEVIQYYEHGGYQSTEYYHHDERIKQIINQLINGFFPHVLDEFEVIYDSLLMQNDHYFVLRDFDSYVCTQEKIGVSYQIRDEWLKKSAINIAHSGYFSSDRTIQQYADSVWKITAGLLEKN
ncbi:glycogen/starch/alpha-glucan phosphorylase [Cytobacillus sp. Hm23]